LRLVTTELSKPGISPNITGAGANPNGTAESGPLPSAKTLMHLDAGRDADSHAGPSKQNIIAIAIRKVTFRVVFIRRNFEWTLGRSQAFL
jgi:hypothetical protein